MNLQTSLNILRYKETAGTSFIPCFFQGLMSRLFRGDSGADVQARRILRPKKALVNSRFCCLYEELSNEAIYK